jgi:hypothetical protein
MTGPLLVEPCPRCGRARTTVVDTRRGEAVPVCPCCGGGPLERDRGCKHEQKRDGSG